MPNPPRRWFQPTRPAKYLLVAFVVSMVTTCLIPIESYGGAIDLGLILLPYFVAAFFYFYHQPDSMDR